MNRIALVLDGTRNEPNDTTNVSRLQVLTQSLQETRANHLQIGGKCDEHITLVT